MPVRSIILLSISFPDEHACEVFIAGRLVMAIQCLRAFGNGLPVQATFHGDGRRCECERIRVPISGYEVVTKTSPGRDGRVDEYRASEQDESGGATGSDPACGTRCWRDDRRGAR